MDDRGGSFVAVRRISQGLERGNNTSHSSSGCGRISSLAWPWSFLCFAQRRESDARPSFDLTPPQVIDQYGNNPFAVAGVNITFMLIQMLDLEAVKPRTLVGATFLKFLSEDDSAFDLLYCITFKLMDHEWLDMHAFIYGLQCGNENNTPPTRERAPV
ncbi:hypothetical protein NC651_031527 [Populus alba x Populus x berolinensis]|nr:hypothetical protein NC651_031527 [Populus alba x Populus x berolinensis]